MPQPTVTSFRGKGDDQIKVKTTAACDDTAIVVSVDSDQ
jgi:hypothetical protein